MFVRAGSFKRYGVPACPAESTRKVCAVPRKAGTIRYDGQFKSKHPGGKKLHNLYTEPTWRRNSNEPKDDS